MKLGWFYITLSLIISYYPQEKHSPQFLPRLSADTHLFLVTGAEQENAFQAAVVTTQV